VPAASWPRAATAEGARQVLTLALLQQHHGDREQARDHVQDDDQIEKDGHVRRRASLLHVTKGPPNLKH
jgi:hypothetical protein